MRTITANTSTNGTPARDFKVNIHANGQMRELISYNDLTDNERRDFDYLDATDHDNAQLFRYLGAVYDMHEFEIAPHWLKANGYDAIATDSAFSAVVITYFDEFGYELDGVIVARIHW